MLRLAVLATLPLVFAAGPAPKLVIRAQSLSSVGAVRLIAHTGTVTIGGRTIAASEHDTLRFFQPFEYSTSDDSVLVKFVADDTDQVLHVEVSLDGVRHSSGTGPMVTVKRSSSGAMLTATGIPTELLLKR